MNGSNTSTDVPAGINGLDAVRTQGVRHNRKLQFNLSLSGDEIYRTLKIIEGLAVKVAAQAGSFLDVAECVHISDRIREQARKQGF